MGISKVPRRGLSMQDPVGGDNNRTPVKFRNLISLFLLDSAGFLNNANQTRGFLCQLNMPC